MSADDPRDSTVTLGLSKNLEIPILLRIDRLVCPPATLARGSEKVADPIRFQKLSAISANSDLFLRVRVLDGAHNAWTHAVQTPYRPFSSNTRRWTTCVRLPITYSQPSYTLYLEVVLYELVHSRPVVFGSATLSLYNHAQGTLRMGHYKVPVALGALPKQAVDYGPLQPEAAAEQQEFAYGDGKIPQIHWLDPLVLPLRHDPPTEPFLYVQLPQFRVPVVFLDANLAVAAPEPRLSAPPELENGLIINSIEIPGVQINDTDFVRRAIATFNVSDLETEKNTAFWSPIEAKYHVLASNTVTTSTLDLDAKPAPHTRNELARILARPASATLSDHEKQLVWRYRYFYTQTDDLPSLRPFFTKFLRSFSWENEAELNHAFSAIVPLWSVDRIDIGDALELLLAAFDPTTLAAPIRRRMVSSDRSRDVNTAEEKKIAKIHRHATHLKRFAVDRLRKASAKELMLYLLQLVQALRYESILKGADPLAEAPLARFLIEKAVRDEALGNFFYWYVKVENEDLLKRKSPDQLYNIVLNTYIEKLKAHCARTKLPHYEYLKRQIAFIKGLTALVELLRSSFKKNEATAKKAQFLRDHLADPANGMLKFDPFPLPLDPSVMLCGCYPADCTVFKSSMAPLKITFKTLNPVTPQSSSMFTKKSHGLYPLMFKIGDDLRQDQLVIQIITLMDQLLKKENLNLKLTPYKILATSPIAGLIQFIPNVTLDLVLSKSYSEDANGILTYLRQNSRTSPSEEPEDDSVLKSNSTLFSQQPAISTDLGVSSIVMDNYVKSCAGYCVITYILGVGDRHLDNLLLSPNGKFWHADFGYILGRDPKPFPPLMKLPIQIIDGMGGMSHENFNVFKSYCFVTYTTLRRNSNLILNLFQLMLDANIPDIQIDPKRSVEKVQDKFALEMSEEEAILHFQNLIIDSVNAFLPVVIDTLHSLAQYWRA